MSSFKAFLLGVFAFLVAACGYHAYQDHVLLHQAVGAIINLEHHAGLDKPQVVDAVPEAK